MAGPNSCPWGTLPPELVVRIAHNLPPNEVACTFRLVNKLTGKHLKGWILVRLSQPVPHHAFVGRWGDERSVHDFTLERRQQLLCLTARSGVVANLEVAVAAVGCRLTHRVFDAAAEAGHVVVCDWLLDRGHPRIAEEAIRCAARGGHTAVVRWLLAQSHGLAHGALIAVAGVGQRALCEELLAAGAAAESIMEAAYRAAEGGHVELTEWLLGQLAHPNDISNRKLLSRAACGFELPALQRLFHSRLGSEAPAEFRESHGACLAVVALASPTPDWRAKLEWLEAAGCRLFHNAWTYFHAGGFGDFTKRGDALERVVLLRERGLLDARHLLFAVIEANLSVIRYLRSEGLLSDALDDDVMRTAMTVGDVAVLAELLAAGGRIGPGEVHTAARHGHLHVLHCLEGPEAGPVAAAALREAIGGRSLAKQGAMTGSLELMEWLWERGCPSDEYVFAAAAEAGNTALLERLVARGCPMSCDAYLAAGRNGDLATLQRLRRLNCPWGPDCTTFDRAVYNSGPLLWIRYCCSLEVLRWLVAEGCPVNWRSARVQARARPEGAHDGVMAWIESHIPQALVASTANRWLAGSGVM